MTFPCLEMLVVPFGIGGVFVGLLVVAAVVLLRASAALRQRSDQSQQRATALGFQSVMYPDGEWLRSLADFRLLTSSGTSAIGNSPVYHDPAGMLGGGSGGDAWKSGRHVYNLLTCEREGARLTLFEYSDTTMHGRDSTGTVLWIDSERFNLPRFLLAPRQWFQSIAPASAGDDIDLPGDPAFSTSFRLRGEDVAAIRQILKGGLAAAVERHAGIFLEGEGHRLLIYGGLANWFPNSSGRLDYRLNPEALPAFIEQGLDVYRAICAVPEISGPQTG